jgi:hypothetical protein
MKLLVARYRFVLRKRLRLTDIRFNISDREEELPMTMKLSTLIEMARSVKMSAQDWEEQRRSFAYGNTKLENDRITREMIDQEAEALKRAES